MVSSAGTTVSSLLSSKGEPRRDYSLKVRRLCLIIRARKLATFMLSTYPGRDEKSRSGPRRPPRIPRVFETRFPWRRRFLHRWRRVPTFPSDICARFPCPAICSRLWHHLFEGHGIYTARKLHATCYHTIYANLFFLGRNSKLL